MAVANAYLKSDEHDTSILFGVLGIIAAIERESGDTSDARTILTIQLRAQVRCIRSNVFRHRPGSLQ